MWKTVIDNGKSFNVSVEEANEAEVDSLQEGMKIFDNELDAYKYALNYQKEILNDLTNNCDDEEECNKQLILLTSLMACSTTNLAKIKGNERLASIEIWDSFYKKAVAMASGNIDTKSPDEFKDVLKPDEIRYYICQWMLAYLDRFSKCKLPEDAVKTITDNVIKCVNDCYNLIFGENVKAEISNK